MSGDLVILRQGDPIVVLRELNVPLIVEQEVPVSIMIEHSGTTIEYYATGTGAVWGAVTGTITDQTDLQAAFDLKLDEADFSIIDGGNF